MHRKVIQKEKKWLKTSKSPMIRGSFQVPNMRWRVQKLVLLTAADMIDQKNQLREVAQCQKYSKTAAEVEKKVTTFGENIHLEKFQPYGIWVRVCNLAIFLLRVALIFNLLGQHHWKRCGLYSGKAKNHLRIRAKALNCNIFIVHLPRRKPLNQILKD